MWLARIEGEYIDASQELLYCSMRHVIWDWNGTLFDMFENIKEEV